MEWDSTSLKERTSLRNRLQVNEEERNMGLRHLRELRDYLEQNADKAFTRTTLRDELKQNYPTIQDNLAYLMDKENVVEQITREPAKFQWKKT